MTDIGTFTEPKIKMVPLLPWEPWPSGFEVQKNDSRLATVVSWFLRSHFTKQEQNRWRKFLSSSKIAIWSILFKYQEMDVQIQTFTDENWNILQGCFFERY